MTIFQIAWKNIKQNPASAVLGILLTAFGSAILCVLLLSSNQIKNQLENNSKGIDLVVGAKGSPLQLILSSIYHMDNPTGNISYAEAKTLAANQLVRLAVPLALGDNYKGHRIVGTDSTFLELYGLELAEGRLWDKTFEAVVGAETASRNNLKVGDKFIGAHGLSEDGHVHDAHPYTITGVLKPIGNVADRLILSSIESVWSVHDIEHDDHDDHDHHDHSDHDHAAHDHHDHDGHEHEGHHHEESAPEQTEEEIAAAHKHHHGEAEDQQEEEVFVKSMLSDQLSTDLEITSMLIRYRSPSAIALFPRLVNQSTSMQAASPAFESTRLFDLLGVGIDALSQLAVLIMLMAAFSVFISLYNAFKSRKYDLAIMRTMGASQGKLFGIVIAEGILLTSIGAILGLIIGHIALYLINQSAANTSVLNALTMHPYEGFILLVGIFIGFLAAIIPAVKAFKTDISQTLSEQ